MYSIMTKLETNSEVTDYYTKLESITAALYWLSMSSLNDTINAWYGYF